MITYNRTAFGLNLVWRVHGSAVYRSIVPSLIAVGIFLMIRGWSKPPMEEFGEDLGHPYAIGVLVASTTFLIVFRANQGYSRYWEAASATHHMMSKWMDATVHSCVYHMQCDHYKDIKPPSYFDYEELNHLNLTRHRERGFDYPEESEYDDEHNNDGVIPEGCEGSEDEDEDDHRDALIGRSDSNSNTDLGGSANTLPGRFPAVGARTPTGTSPTLTNDSGGYDYSGSGSSSSRRASKNIISTDSGHKDSGNKRGRSKLRSSFRASIKPGPGFSDLKREKALRSVVKSINRVDNETFKIKKLRAKSQDARHKKKLLDRQAMTDPRVSIRYRSKSMDDIDRSGSKKVLVHKREFSKYYFNQLHLHKRAGSLDMKPFPLMGRPRLDGNWGAYFSKDAEIDPITGKKIEKATFFNINNPEAPIDPQGFASRAGGMTAPLFLQELAHLSSLLVAVALSTLRNDIEGAESPLAVYEPGSPWPEVDPDKDEWLRMDNYIPRNFVISLGEFLGWGRRPEQQTRYNAARPLPVIGGISDAEIRFLQMARGPYAKTQLCWNWLSEFCIREHLAGSMGNVGPPIISRVIQFLGDGMIFYNHARKVMFIPFPFAHAQLSVFFILVMVPCIPFLMDQYTDQLWLGSILTFFTVLCLSGIHEVARELENPFRNVPNELPLVTFQAQYNEALLTMYSGYHPDHFWDGDRVLKKRGNGSPKNGGGASNLNSQPTSTAAKTTTSARTTSTATTKPTANATPPATTTPPFANTNTTPLTSPTSSAEEGVAATTTNYNTAPTTIKVVSREDFAAAATANVGSSLTIVQNSSTTKSSQDEEIANLKRQLEEQAKLIQQLASKINMETPNSSSFSSSTLEAPSSPSEGIKKVEFITEQAIMKSSSI